MKCICTEACQYNITTRKGDVVEIPNYDTSSPFIKAHFTPLDREQEQEREEQERDGDTVEGLRLRLSELGVRYHPRAGREKLEKLLEEALKPVEL